MIDANQRPSIIAEIVSGKSPQSHQSNAVDPQQALHTPRSVPVIGYRTAEAASPVTRGERWAVLGGYGLILVGFALLMVALAQPANYDVSMRTTGTVTFLTGVGITTLCFVYNAIRRF